ncbi:MAG: GntR family transcriptional regulator [Verrucomicrobia bacterium]|nr:GntR family transcriptional regulator [Verrucomicrobiota bacterium]
MARKKNSGALARGSESREFLYRQIANLLRSEVDDGVYAPGERLPSMDELAAHYEVNKITVLKALDELKSEGVIYSVPAQGTYVTEVQRSRRVQSNNKVLTVGLLSHVLEPHQFGLYHIGVIAGIQDELSRHKGNLLLMPAGHLHTDAELYQAAMEVTADAIIYLGPFHNALLKRLIHSGCPAVIVDYHFEGCPTDTVLIDNAGCGYLAMEHLLQLGHRKIAVIAGPRDQTATDDRFNGMIQALSAVGLSLSDIIVIEGNFMRQSGFDAMCDILNNHGECTGVLCMNDEMATGALQAIHGESDLKVPGDVSVVGIDDVYLSAMTHPPLTSVHVDMRHMGRLAAQRLIDRLEEPGGNPTSTVVSAQLVIRSSTAKPRKTRTA